MTLQEAERISQLIAQQDGWMTEEELKEYRREYDDWLDARYEEEGHFYHPGFRKVSL